MTGIGIKRDQNRKRDQNMNLLKSRAMRIYIANRARIGMENRIAVRIMNDIFDITKQKRDRDRNLEENRDWYLERDRNPKIQWNSEVVVNGGDSEM
ncbi:hypothetical protein EVAR_27794_1 [Eumeta japonica]|uniref:Uncharacterized protein n=1 Tax=Eumeta variegata TaxID=151549 RepID=A0A4C1VHL8_EUMVA|nr:hypothetical protein EVAR_27794_1 [Eumeta japonica]